MDHEPCGLRQRHRCWRPVSNPHLNLPAPQARATARRSEVQYAARRIGHSNPPCRRTGAVLVGQAHGNVATPPAARIVLQRRRRLGRVDHQSRSASLPFCLGQQLVIERHLHAPSRGTEPHSASGDFVALVSQAECLHCELHALGERRLRAATDGRGLVLDDHHGAVVGHLNRVAASGHIEPFGSHVDRTQPLGPRCCRIVHGGVVGEPLRHLPSVRALAVNLEPRPARTERMVRDDADT